MSKRKNKTNRSQPLQVSNDPNWTGELLLNDGAPIQCGSTNAQCCYSAENARDACAKQIGLEGTSYGKYYGYYNISARPIPPGDAKYVSCNQGQPYACYANTKASCPPRLGYAYNKDGPDGSHKVGNQPQNLNDVIKGTPFCQEKNGPNSIMVSTPSTGPQCVIQDWSSQPLEACCTPGNENKMGLYESLCGPHSCFGQASCDNTQIVAQICSDKDNVANDPGCIDTCLRSNDRNSVPWCNPKIKEYCQGKNLETEACRRYCSQDSLDKNPELADFCDVSYSQYCKSTDYSLYSREKQDQLCPCINSSLPIANCVDNKCTNGIGIKTKLLRENKCGGNICISQIYIDVKTGNPIIDIDRVKFEQYCPGVVPPWNLKPKTVQNLEWYIGGPVLLALIVVALVFLFKK